VFALPVTVAVNNCVAPVFRVAVLGVRLTETAAGALTVIVAVADLVVSACEVAVATTVRVLLTVAGAVYAPPLVIVPQAAPLQSALDNAQLTAVFAVPVTVAVKVWVPLVLSETLGGVTLMATRVIVTVAVADFVESA
jgi:hypothetical protein